MGDEKPKTKTNKILFLIISLLAIIAIVLTVLIFVLGGDKRTDREKQTEESNNAINDSYLIINKYNISADYSINDAINDFEELLKKCGSDVCKVRVAISYSDFLYARYANVEKCLDVLNRYRGIIDNVDDYAKIDYYSEFRGLYALDGDKEKSRYYDDLINDIMDGDSEYGEEDEIGGEGPYMEDEE